MFKKLSLIIICGFIFSGCSLIPKKSGLKILSYTEAKVYIDDKEMGMTPYKNNTLSPKEITVKLKTQNNREWVKKIELQPNSNTVINWEFGEREQESGGYLLYLEKTGDNKKAGMIVNATPDKSAIAIEGEIKGFSPIKFDEIGDGDKQITISFPGYKTVNVFIRAINGYRSILETKLAEEKKVIPENNENEAEISGTTQNTKMVTIKETETGWLKVRETASSIGKEITRVKPGEKYKILEEQTDWIKIDLNRNGYGWISAKYALKSE